ncbi:MAG: hypothetical protein ACTSYA_08150 [Candidatus Kariarchaeaceae archaeon]
MNFMKKLVLLSSLLIVMISPANTLNVMGEDPTTATYSTDIVVGDTFTWNVEESSYFNGTDITERDWLYEYLKDDIITIDIIADLAGYDRYDYALDATDFFDTEINGETDYFELQLHELILPVDAAWDNGTEMSFVEWSLIDDYGQDDVTSVKVEGDEVVMKEEFSFIFIHKEEIRYNKNTGVLNYYHVESNVFDWKLTFSLEGYSRPSSSAPFASLLYIAAGMLAIPVIVRLRRKD